MGSPSLVRLKQLLFLCPSLACSFFRYIHFIIFFIFVIFVRTPYLVSALKNCRLLKLPLLFRYVFSHFRQYLTDVFVHFVSFAIPCIFGHISCRREVQVLIKYKVIWSSFHLIVSSCHPGSTRFSSEFAKSTEMVMFYIVNHLLLWVRVKLKLCSMHM